MKLDSQPPAELLACPVEPDPFPANGSAVIPAEIRAPMIGLAKSYAGVVAQLRRLIHWHRPDAPC